MKALSEEFERGCRDLRMKGMAVDSRMINAAFREFAPPLVVALVGEYLVADRAANSPELCNRNVTGGKDSVLFRRRLRVGGSHRQVDRNP